MPNRPPKTPVILSKVMCPLPGCPDRKMPSNLVCLKHSVEIWQNVQALKGEPLVYEAMVESVAEREARADAAKRKRLEFNKQHGLIYYIRVDDKIKIGWSSNLPQRLRSYPPHMVLLTNHPGTRADERDLHRSFKPSLAAGREWYYPTTELIAHIERAERAEMERRNTEHWASVERLHGTDHMLKVKAWSERPR